MTSFTSSGDLSADRRYLWGEASRKEGDFAGAADLFAQATEAAPKWAAAWFALGEAQVRLGATEAAAQSLRACLALRPDDPFGAALRLARIEHRSTHAMPERYVAQMFDDYADRFDAHLTTALKYRGPAVIVDALAQAGPQPARYAQVCDLGCGTGLMAAALEGAYADMDGVDLSARMIDKARETGRYRTLAVADITTFLGGAAAPLYDLIVAADVFVYVGDLRAVLEAAHRRAMPEARFAFTVQSLPGEGFHLGADMRFAHSARYIHDTAATTGWRVDLLTPATTRQDAGKDVAGFVGVLARQGA